jgi:medium-chain acyl-[acyl-carrier-protein] hydrolase
MAKPDPGSSWFVTKPTPGARVRLFCFPFSGGGSTAYRGWAEALRGVEVTTVIPPGREVRLREPAFTRMEPLVAALVEALRPRLDDRPFAFFGHSLGAYVALEAARALRRANAPMPRHLFASGCPAPDRRVSRPPIHALPDRAFIEALRRYGGTPEEVLRHEELMELLMPVLRADLEVYETHRDSPEPPLDLPLSAFGGEDDDRATPAEVEGWRAHTSQAFSLRLYPGRHFFVHAERERVHAAILEDLAPLLT